MLSSKRREHDRNTSQVEKIDRSVKCYECEEYGYFQAECATFLKRKKKSLTITLSDEETTSDSDSESYGRALISCEVKEVLEKVDINIELHTDALESLDDKEPKFSPSGFEELLYLWKEDQELLKQHQERFLKLFKLLNL